MLYPGGNRAQDESSEPLNNGDYVALAVFTACGGYAHLDGVFLTVINKGNRLVLSLDAIHGYTRLAIPA